MTLAEWLTACGNIVDIEPVRVRIGDESWEACRYTQISEHDGKKYRNKRIYCVGNWPKSYRPNRREGGTCYPFEGRDWYVCCYIKDIKPVFAPYHPFGPNFILGEWEHSEPMDQYEQPYERIPMTLDKL